MAVDRVGRVAARAKEGSGGGERRRRRGRGSRQLLRQGCCGIRGCQVRRVAARVETRERSSEIPSRDIGHSLTRPPTALAES